MELNSRDADVVSIFGKGLQAHNAGDLSAAEQFYQETLSIQPNHSEANHNIGVVLATKNELNKALKFFKYALDNSPNVSLFWASYIDALIKLGRIAESKTLTKAVTDAGLSCEKMEAISQRLETEHQEPGETDTQKLDEYYGYKASSSVDKKRAMADNNTYSFNRSNKTPTSTRTINSIKNFYKTRQGDIINAASAGWFFTAAFDKHFMSPQLAKASVHKVKNKTLPKIPLPEKANPKLLLSIDETIDFLKQPNKITDKFNRLKLLICSHNSHLIQDSFCQDMATQISDIQQRTFNKNGFNVVIIGAGATGLFLASILKYALAKDVNILVIDNRSSHKNTRKNFNRNWLTHIPTSIVQKFIPPNIKEFFECFGNDGLIGIPINALEAVLMLSCKEQGVKFYFSSSADLTAFNNKSIDCFFDATAGHLTSKKCKASKHQSFKIHVANQNMSFEGTSVNQLSNFSSPELSSLEIILKSSGSFYYPFIDGCRIRTYMFKLTSIPINFMKKAKAFVKPHNAYNQFFIWDGTLKDEINEGMIFINLTSVEYKILLPCLKNSIGLNSFFSTNYDILSVFNEATISLLKLLSELDRDSRIIVEKPFSYSPYINLNANGGRFNQKPIFPIGDSLFCGHPKVANGLSQHLDLLNELLIAIITSRKPKLAN